MAEVFVIASSVAREGSEVELRELLRGMLLPTRSESGCKLYELYESDVQGCFYFYEIWESQSALERHAASPHFRHLQQAIRECAQKPLHVNILQQVTAAAA